VIFNVNLGSLIEAALAGIVRQTIRSERSDGEESSGDIFKFFSCSLSDNCKCCMESLLCCSFFRSPPYIVLSQRVVFQWRYWKIRAEREKTANCIRFEMSCECKRNAIRIFQWYHCRNARRFFLFLSFAFFFLFSHSQSFSETLKNGISLYIPGESLLPWWLLPLWFIRCGNWKVND
jgi:hypothetical protein